jgi:ribosome-associated toxin RatA of RatAB toxin-antitoxin module
MAPGFLNITVWSFEPRDEDHTQLHFSDYEYSNPVLAAVAFRVSGAMLVKS